jgi:integrase
LECQIVPNVRFTDLSVRSLKPGLYFDEVTPAFGLRVGAHRRTWLVVKGDRAHRSKVRLGHYPALTLSDARKKALVALGSPYAPKAKAPTYGEAVPAFLEDHYDGKSARSRHEATRLLGRINFHAKQLSDIGDEDLERELSRLAHIPSEQLHAFRALRVFFKWCTRPPRRFIRHSPLEGFEPPSQDKKGTRTLTDKELVKIWHACDRPYGGMVRLLILWGTRNGETGRLRREWMDRKAIVIPGEVTKNKRAHTIPLHPLARSVLADQKSNGSYFFPGKRMDDSFFKDGSWGKLKKEIEKASGVTGWQLRDIRRTFRSNMAKLKVPREICEILLNHVTGANKNDLDEIYNRYDYFDEKREALGKWEKRLSLLLGVPGK